MFNYVEELSPCGSDVSRDVDVSGRDSRRSHKEGLGFSESSIVQQRIQRMKRYLVMAMRNPTFSDEAIAPHLAFLDQLRAAGQLEMTGGFTDKSGGAYLLAADTLEEAQAIVDRDPLATCGSSTLTVYEWNTH
jgi:uncharacterized protein YciI